MKTDGNNPTGIFSATGNRRFSIPPQLLVRELYDARFGDDEALCQMLKDMGLLAKDVKCHSNKHEGVVNVMMWRPRTANEKGLLVS